MFISKNSVSFRLLIEEKRFVVKLLSLVVSSKGNVLIGLGYSVIQSGGREREPQ